MMLEPAKEKAKASPTNATQSGAFTGARTGTASAAGEMQKALVTLMMRIKKGETSGKGASPELDAAVQSLVSDMKSAQSEFQGIISRCWISGNDCHLLGGDLEILGHFNSSQAVPDAFTKIRPHVSKLPMSILAVFVFSDGCEYLFADGTTGPAEF